MPKIYIEHIKEQYGFEHVPDGGFRGKTYQDLISKVIEQNSRNISNRVAEISKDQWGKALDKITTEEKRFIVPDVSNVLPARSVFIKKAAESGDSISQSLRDALTKNLRDTMNQFTEVTGEAKFIRRRGVHAGTVNPGLIDQFQESIRSTFESYVRKGELEKVPGNVATIAKTEVRSAVNEIKKTYVSKLKEKNPDLIIKKRWRHNRRLSKRPRRGHELLNGVTIDNDRNFIVAVYRDGPGGKQIFERWETMDGPHDVNASPENTIGCNCDLEHVISRSK